MKEWLQALRLRTLPLAIAAVGAGVAAAKISNNVNIEILLWCMLTAALLQIVSNLANDLGDTLHGADNAHRIGPARTVQSGAIPMQSMRLGVCITSILAFLAGIRLLLLSYRYIGTMGFIFFLVLGMFSIMAALLYTLGKRPYGYAALGDLSVFLFFGLVGVLGSGYLISEGQVQPLAILPAISVGVLCTAVLHLNNMRDMLSDTMAGKNTVAIKLGYVASKYYLYLLILFGLVGGILFVWLTGHNALLLMLPAYVLLRWVIQPVSATSIGDNLDLFLPKLAIGTILFVVAVNICVWWL